MKSKLRQRMLKKQSKGNDSLRMQNRREQETLPPQDLWVKYRPLQGYLDSLKPERQARILQTSRECVFRILKGWPIQYLIIGGYILVVVITLFAPPEIIGIAYDSGGVTTSTITVPLVTALGVGLAGVIRGRNPMIDGFGLIAFASLTPMIFVMVYGMVY